MGILGGVGGAKGSEGGVYFLPGNYLAEIQRCKLAATRKKRDFFVAEFKIVKSDNPERKPGALVSFMVMLDKDDDEAYRMQLGNVADFMRVGLSAFAKQTENVDMKPEDVPLDDETAEVKVCGQENMLAGTLLDVHAFNKPTKAGTDFTHHKWSVPVAAAPTAA